MNQFIGLDVSLKDTFISVRKDGRRISRGKCPSDPKLIAEVIRKRAPNVERVVFETGSLSVWFYHALTLEGLRAVCIDSCRAKAALDIAPIKPMRTTRTGSRIFARSVFTARCGLRALTAC